MELARDWPWLTRSLPSGYRPSPTTTMIGGGSRSWMKKAGWWLDWLESPEAWPASPVIDRPIGCTHMQRHPAEFPTADWG